MDVAEVSARGKAGELEVVFSGLPVREAASGRAYVYPDFGAELIRALQDALPGAWRRSPIRLFRPSCRACGARPTGDTTVELVETELRLDRLDAFRASLSVPVQRCPRCGTVHLAGGKRTKANLSDAVMAALQAAGVTPRMTRRGEEGVSMQAQPVDPLAGPITEPAVGAYVYVRDNPVNRVDPSGRCIGPAVFLAPVCIGTVVGVAGYFGGTVLGNTLQGNEPTEGLNATDAAISGLAGGISGGVGAQPIGVGSKIIMNADIGFDATLWAMISGGRNNPGELLVGSATAGVGGGIDIKLGVLG
jgi:hypothetical protein